MTKSANDLQMKSQQDTQGLNPHPYYKDSGIPWLDAIPEHWKVERAKWLFRKMDRPVRESDDVVTCFRDGTVTLRKNRRVRGFTESLKEIGYQGIRRGDLVIHAMDAFAGAIGVSDSDGKGTPVYSVCEPRHGTNAYYYAYIIREMARSQWILALAKGIRERSTDFRFEGFSSQFVPCPPLEEQISIVRFLDYIERRIKDYIRAKKKLITLLNEQKQASIQQAVTRGLDPNVQLKPSGIEWLGDLPMHWKVMRLKFLCSIKTGGRDTVDRVEKGLFPFFVRSQNVEKIDSYSFDGEGVLTAGDGAGVAKVFHYIKGKFDFHQRVYLFSKFRFIDGKFFYYYFMNNLKFEAFRETAKSTVDSLRLPMLQNLPVALPPIEDQKTIVESLEKKLNIIEQVLSRTIREIEIMHELRARLVTDVVTGKLDIRETASYMPDVAEKIESMADEDGLIENDEYSEEIEDYTASEGDDT